VACLSAAAGLAAPIRNVILCIGDGMGPAQVEAARCYAGTQLFFETFPYQSLITTFAAGGQLTDSAAAATAIATGYKVYEGVLSLALPGDGRELETLLEAFQSQGKSAGLVTTSYLTDATPAAFGAHETDRYNQTQIASDYLVQTRPDVLMGGGGGGELTAAAAAAAGYQVVSDAAGLAAVDAARTARVCGLFGYWSMPYEYDGLGPFPRLTDMALKALEVLDNDPDGFFLMVEGGRIDHACHAHDLPRSVFETLAFDAVVRRLTEWAQGRGDTLILVVSDHETGGLSVLADNGAGTFPDVTWSTWGHTGTPVTLYGWGVNADLVTHVADNTGVCAVARSAALMPAVAVACERVASDRFNLTWAVSSGDVYRVEQSLALLPPDWRPSGVVTAVSTRVDVVDTNAAGRAQGYYRLISTQAAP